MKENLVLIDVDYTLAENKGVVRLFCKDTKGKTVLVQDDTFLPYFYVLPKGLINKLKKKIEKIDTKRLETKILKVEVIEKNWQNKNTKLIKIIIDNPRRIPDIRDVVKEWKEVDDTFEYDIPFYKRYIINKQIEPTGWIEVTGEESKDKTGLQVDRVLIASSIKPLKLKKEINFRVLAFDTEFVEENKKSKLIMLSIVSNAGLKKVITRHHWNKKPSYVEVVNNEAEIIQRFVEVVKEVDPDFICTYNGDNFDFPKLKERATEARISLKLGRDNRPVFVVRRGRISSAKTKGSVHIDLFDFVDHILSPSMKSEVKSLDEVSQELLGMSKKEMKYKDMVEIWSKKDHMERLVEYNLWDSELTLKLSEHILPQIFSICKLTGTLPFDSSRYTYSQLVESFYMRKAFLDNVLIPNRPKTEEIEQRRLEPKYKGAIVIEPKKGIHPNVLVFDFRSLYPTIIVTHNIDPWTYNFSPCNKKANIPESKGFFCQDVKGFIPKHLEEIINTRKETKELMKKFKKDSEDYHLLNNEQYALKIIANASYGYLAYFGAKWYRLECGSAAASWGRYYINKVIEFSKKEGFEIIYGDTDSLMVNLNKEMSESKLREIGEQFANKVNKQLPGIIELEFRDLYEGGIFVAREKGEVGAKKRYALVDYDGNLEIRGFETVRRDWCELSKRIQRDVLITILREKNPKKAVGLVRDVIEKIKSGKVTLEELTIFEQITRPLSSYEQIGPHVKAAMKAQAKGELVGEGTIIGFVITKGSGSISDRAEPIEFVKPNQYDPKYYIEHQILPASMRVLKALGLTEKEVISGKVQVDLSKFLKK